MKEVILHRGKQKKVTPLTTMFNNFLTIACRVSVFSLLVLVFPIFSCQEHNRDPRKAEIITTDLSNFWEALEMAGPEVDPLVLEGLYLKPGSEGVRGFMDDRIKSAEHLSQVIRSHRKYYRSIRTSMDSIDGMGQQLTQIFTNFQEVYPQAIFPPIYFVIGALNSGGTTSDDGLIIGAEMYGLTPLTPKDELSPWLQMVIKPASQVPHIVAHELIHVQQNYRFWHRSLLAACIKEGSADFLAELISGKHINQHVHDFADPREKELWQEFRERMEESKYDGWLYGSTPDRPNDLGYWMGYKITKAYYDNTNDKKAAIRDILNIHDFEGFLKKSGYALKFE